MSLLLIVKGKPVRTKCQCCAQMFEPQAKHLEIAAKRQQPSCFICPPCMKSLQDDARRTAYA